jgi:hypothetical protein
MGSAFASAVRPRQTRKASDISLFDILIDNLIHMHLLIFDIEHIRGR